MIIQLCTGWLATDKVTGEPADKAQDHSCGHYGAAGLGQCAAKAGSAGQELPHKVYT